MGPGPRGPGNARRGAKEDVKEAASMGPGPRGPGNACVIVYTPPIQSASMGPGPRGPGNRTGTYALVHVVELQWGRDRAVPEMRCQLRCGHP